MPRRIASQPIASSVTAAAPSSGGQSVSRFRFRTHSRKCVHSASVSLRGASTLIRSVGSIGNPSIYTFENDTGTDGANHDRTAFFSMMNLPGQPMGKIEGMNLVDVGPTILKMYGIEAPEGAVGRSFL